MKYNSFFIFLFLFVPYSLKSEALLTIFLRSYPTVFPEKHAEELQNSLDKPGKIARYTAYFHNDIARIAGIYATYGGFIDISDVHGQLTFPLKHASNRIILIITSKITPIVLAQNTVHHWELEEGTPVALYLVEKKEDKETKLSYWQTTSYPYPPDRQIPLDSLLIFARPKDVYVPIGITVAQQSPHLLLPTIYIKKGVKITQNALYTLNLKQFFGPVGYQYRRQRTQYSSHIIY